MSGCSFSAAPAAFRFRGTSCKYLGRQADDDHGIQCFEFAHSQSLLRRVLARVKKGWILARGARSMRASDLSPAAIDDQLGTGDVAGIIGGEE